MLFFRYKKNKKNKDKKRIVVVLNYVLGKTWEILRKHLSEKRPQNINIAILDIFYRSGVCSTERKKFSQIFQKFERIKKDIQRLFDSRCLLNSEDEYDLFVAACEVLRVAKRINDDGKNFSVVIKQVEAAEREWQRKLISCLNTKGTVDE